MNTKERRHHHARGSIYLAATSGIVLVTGLALSATAMLRAERASHRNINETAQARALADAGLRLAIQRITDDRDWRTSYTNAGWTWSLHDTTINATLTDPTDDNLTDSPDDPVRITVFATAGTTRQGVTAEFNLVETGAPILAYAIAAGGGLNFASSAIDADNSQGIYTHGRARLTTASVNADLAATNQVQRNLLSLVTGTTTQYAPSITMPDPDKIIKAWAPLAEPINDPEDLEDETLSPSNNPSGGRSSRGIYLIDADHEKLTIEDLEANATIIIINASNGVELEGESAITPPSRGFPALIVEGDLDIDSDGESVNIQGLVYATGDIEIEDDATIAGPIVAAGLINIKDAVVDVTPKLDYSTAPPEGFHTEMAPALINASWKRAID